MKYDKYTLITTTEAEDIVISTLYDLGIEGAQIVDKVPLSEAEKAGMFVDILPEGEPDDGSATINFFLDATLDNSELIESVKAELEDLRLFCEPGSLELSVEHLEDTDYLNNWKEFFHSFMIDDILFTPSWEEVPADVKSSMVIHIDPGTAFGTGKHETTSLCIEELRRYIKPGDSFLDVGTGSGILAIMAYKFGATKAVGTDLDVCAIDAVKDNMAANELDEACFELIIGNIIDDKEIQDEVGYECYDVVAANILAEVLLPLTPQVVRHLKKDGIYITSGIIDDKEEVVKKAIEDAGLTVLEINHKGEWVSIVARK